MLEMIREYASERLWASEEISTEGSVNEREATEGAHALYFIEFARKATLRMHSADGTTRISRLERELDNIREVLGYLLDRERRDAASTRLALRLSAAMGPFWRARGYFSEGLEWLNRVLSDAESVEWDPTDRRKQVASSGNLELGGMARVDTGRPDIGAPFLWGGSGPLSRGRGRTGHRALAQRSCAIGARPAQLRGCHHLIPGGPGNRPANE